MKMEILAKILHGDCTKKIKEIEDNTIDLIFTSPPYACSASDGIALFLPLNKLQKDGKKG